MEGHLHIPVHWPDHRVLVQSYVVDRRTLSSPLYEESRQKEVVLIRAIFVQHEKHVELDRVGRGQLQLGHFEVLNVCDFPWVVVVGHLSHADVVIGPDIEAEEHFFMEGNLPVVQIPSDCFLEGLGDDEGVQDVEPNFLGSAVVVGFDVERLVPPADLDRFLNQNVELQFDSFKPQLVAFHPALIRGTIANDQLLKSFGISEISFVVFVEEELCFEFVLLNY